MWPFGPRLSGQQRVELSAYVDLLNASREVLSSAFELLSIEVHDLRARCWQGARLGVDVIGTTAEVEAAADAVETYGQELDEVMAGFLDSPPEDWYPKKLRKTYDDLVQGLNAQRQMLRSVRDALADPPLVVTPGKDKPNMFASGLNYIDDLVRLAPQAKVS